MYVFCTHDARIYTLKQRRDNVRHDSADQFAVEYLSTTDSGNQRDPSLPSSSLLREQGHQRIGIGIRKIEEKKRRFHESTKRKRTIDRMDHGSQFISRYSFRKSGENVKIVLRSG